MDALRVGSCSYDVFNHLSIALYESTILLGYRRNLCRSTSTDANCEGDGAFAMNLLDLLKCSRGGVIMAISPIYKPFVVDLSCFEVCRRCSRCSSHLPYRVRGSALRIEFFRGEYKEAFWWDKYISIRQPCWWFVP